MADDDEVGTAVVARHYGVTQKCVRGWAHRGELASWRDGRRGPLRFRWADVRAFRRPVASTVTEQGSAAA